MTDYLTMRQREASRQGALSDRKHCLAAKTMLGVRGTPYATGLLIGRGMGVAGAVPHGIQCNGRLSVGTPTGKRLFAAAAMAVAYAMVSRQRPYWDDGAESVSAGLVAAAGERLEHLEEVPACGRPGLAISLGLLGRDQDVRTVLSSIPPADLDRLKPDAYYLVASELLRYNKCLRTAIWAWKTEAARRGAMDRALVCSTIRAACRRLGDPEVVREELIPWAEEALAMPGSESQWHRALPALLWAYDYVGERQKAIERGRYWLQEAKERHVSAKSLAHARHLLDTLTDTTDPSPPGGG